MNKIQYSLFILFTILISACQKMERPKLGDYPKDPPKPPYSILKSYWTFDGHARDTGQYRAVATTKNVTYVDGVKGQAAKIGDGGYIMIPTIDDSMATPGSLTVAFWLNGKGPVTGGAQGLFALANKNAFWGNVEIFLENLENGDEAFVKVHLLNGSLPKDKEENWIEQKIPGLLNKWSHLAITYNAENSKFVMYANGEPVKEAVLNAGNYGPLKFKDFNGIVLGSFAFQTDPSLTNHGPEGWARSFNGALDNFRVYNVALNADEVKKLYVNKE